MSVSDSFRNGGSYLISQENFDRYIAGRDTIGRPDGQFMVPKQQMDDLMARHPDDVRAWEQELGLQSGSLGQHPYRVDVYDPTQHNLRTPDASLSGANDQFTGTGKTTGGLDEGVTDPFPNPQTSPEVGGISRVGSLERDLNDPNLFQGKPGDITYQDSGQGKSAYGVLSDQPGERNAYAQRTVGGADRRPGKRRGQSVPSVPRGY